MTESELILAAVRRWYPPRLFAVCDRVREGLGLSYEADAIAISKTGLVDELEAKSTLSDLRADLKKHKWKLIETGNRQHFADRFWYVVPEKLETAAVRQGEPRGFGVVVVRHVVEGAREFDYAERVLKAKALRPRTDRSHLKAELWRLASLRYWDAVETRMELGRENKRLIAEAQKK